MKHTQTSDPFQSQQQVRVFTLCYAVLNDVTEVWKSHDFSGRTIDGLFKVSVEMLLDSTDKDDVSFCCVSLLNKLHLDLSFCYIRKPLARKLMTLLYRSLRAAEESSCLHIVDSRCTRRHLAVITYHTADVQECALIFLRHVRPASMTSSQS